jgi:hypothetical protein
MSAHITGELGKYKQNGNGSFQGEGAGTKVGQALMRTAIGAGAGAALGTAVGAIAGRGNNTVGYAPVYEPYGATVVPVGYAPSYSNGAARGAGRGAWSGAAIGGGVGLAACSFARARTSKSLLEHPYSFSLMRQLRSAASLNTAECNHQVR